MALEKASGRGEGNTRASVIPPFDYLWDFLYGTANDLNFARLVDHYESYKPEVTD